jgi:hypothetical protein
MKTVTSTLFLSTRALAVLFFMVSAASEAPAAPKVPSARLLDMYAVREGDQYVVHVVASGDISQFLSDRKSGEGSYHLTLDVPAISPSTAKFDVATPFSRRFQVWPMQLGKKIYSRIEIELDVEASSVVGLENPSHLFVRIHRELPPGMQVAESSVPSQPSTAPKPSVEDPSAGAQREPKASRGATAAGVGPRGIEESAAPATDDGGSVPPPSPPETEVAGSETPTPVASIEAPESAAGDELFFSLFPAPVRKQQTLFNVAAEEPLYSDEAALGIRLGRFAVLPSIDLSWIRGDNLLQTSEAPFIDNAYTVRGRVTATLLETAHDLKLAYEARYRDFQDFTLEDKLTHLVDLRSELELTPNTKARVSNHFVHGSFEAREFDPGGEVVASTDPFYRNYADAVLALDLSERFGAEISANYNVVEFLDTSTDFFDYHTQGFGGTFLYDLSPLTSLLGEYIHTITPEPLDHPQAGSVADMFLVGLRGEFTPMLRGQIRAGYTTQRFELATVSQDFSGFVADLSLTRDFGEVAALTALLGRRTNPSAFDENGYYVSNYGRVQFISPFARNFRMTLTGALYLNDYPIADASGVIRDDDIFSAGAGLAYFFTPLTFLSVDYRHDQRNSNIELFAYQSNAIQLMVGFGFLNR